MDEQEKRETTEAERQHNEAGKQYAEAGELYDNTVRTSKQSGGKRREEAEQRQADEEAKQQQLGAAVEQLTDATRQSFQTLADRAVALQESNLRLTHNFFQTWIEQVHNQAQGTREATQNLRDQGQRQREAIEAISQEATNTKPTVSVDQPSGKKVKTRKPTIIGTATDAQENLDKADIKVFLKGKEVTNFTYDQATDMVQFVPDKKLKRGKKYTVRIQATDAQGLSTNAKKTFKVKNKKK
ncbi:MAG: hypothetical protein WKF67_07520 [Rubrobacteraceae bacterium]|jgi:hypothetical protein